MVVGAAEGDQAPANTVIAVHQCGLGGLLVPGDVVARVDGEPWSVVPALVDGREAFGLLRLDPEPPAGARVELFDCWGLFDDGQRECLDPEAGQRRRIADFIATAPDHERLPGLPVGLELSQSHKLDDGIDCPPYGDVLHLDVQGPSDASIFTYVADLRSEDGEEVTALLLPYSSASSVIPVSDGDKQWCVELSAIDGAGNATPAGSACVAPERSRGCSVASGGSVWAFGLLGLLWALRRRAVLAAVIGSGCADEPLEGEELRKVTAEEACASAEACGAAQPDCEDDYASGLRDETDACVETIRDFNACLVEHNLVCDDSLDPSPCAKDEARQQEACPDSDADE